MKHEQEMVGGQRTANVEQISYGCRSGSALRSGPGVRVELGGDQTGPVFLRLAVAKLGLEVQADEGMKNVVGLRPQRNPDEMEELLLREIL